MPTIDYKEISRKLFEKGWNEGRVDVLEELNSPECSIVDPYVPITTKGPAAAKEYFEFYKKALPDLFFRVDEQVAENDVVVNFLTATATHGGPLLGLPPTNKKATVKAISTLYFKNGKIIRATNMWDALDFMRKVGLAEPIMTGAHA